MYSNVSDCLFMVQGWRGSAFFPLSLYQATIHNYLKATAFKPHRVLSRVLNKHRNRINTNRATAAEFA